MTFCDKKPHGCDFLVESWETFQNFSPAPSAEDRQASGGASGETGAASTHSSCLPIRPLIRARGYSHTSQRPRNTPPSHHPHTARYSWAADTTPPRSVPRRPLTRRRPAAPCRSGERAGAYSSPAAPRTGAFSSDPSSVAGQRGCSGGAPAGKRPALRTTTQSQP